MYKKLMRYSLGGIINYPLKIGLTFLLTEIFHMWYFYAYSITLIAIIIFSFFYNMFITYKVYTQKKLRLIVYSIILIIFTIIDAIAVKILTEGIHIHYLISITTITATLFFVKYFVYDKMVFMKNMKTPREEKKKPFKNIEGNHFDKHNSKNPVVQYLMRNFHKKINTFIKRTRAKEILDIGCGEGYTTANIQKQNKAIHIEGVEYGQRTVQKAKHLHPHISFEQGSIYEINKHNKSYNLTIASEVLEHLEFPLKGLKELRRVSKKFVLVSVPNEPWWRIVNMLRLTYLKDWGNTPGHVNHWSKHALKKFLKPHFKKVIVKNAIIWNIALCIKKEEKQDD
jgi:2-polyprenyl-3-methyl-5-hydroxy-6-metoxy-1,4-benzoquinol methylase/putative flippase GtrA